MSLSYYYCRNVASRVGTPELHYSEHLNVLKHCYCGFHVLSRCSLSTSVIVIAPSEDVTSDVKSASSGSVLR